MTYAVVATINAQGVSDPRRQTLANVREALPGVAIAGLQEVKNLRGDWSLRNQLSRRTMGVAQVTRTPATSGVAIVWDKSRVRAVKDSQRIALGVKPDGQQLLARYLLAVDLVIDGRLIVTAIDGHRPPVRDRELWPAYDATLARLVNQARHPVILFTDNNAAAMPRTLVGELRPHARRIDMICTDPQLRIDGPAFDLPATKSDHRPVGLRIEVRR